MASASREGSEDNLDDGEKEKIPGFKVAMLGASGVGKTALTYQFTTSEYICAYDLSLGKLEKNTVPRFRKLTTVVFR